MIVNDAFIVHKLLHIANTYIFVLHSILHKLIYKFMHYLIIYYSTFNKRITYVQLFLFHVANQAQYYLMDFILN